MIGGTHAEVCEVTLPHDTSAPRGPYSSSAESRALRVRRRKSHDRRGPSFDHRESAAKDGVGVAFAAAARFIL